MAKRAREQAVKEKRERKHERKAAAAAARLAGDVAPTDELDGEPGCGSTTTTRASRLPAKRLLRRISVDTTLQSPSSG